MYSDKSAPCVLFAAAAVDSKNERLTFPNASPNESTQEEKKPTFS